MCCCPSLFLPSFRVKRPEATGNRTQEVAIFPSPYPAPQAQSPTPCVSVLPADNPLPLPSATFQDMLQALRQVESAAAEAQDLPTKIGPITQNVLQEGRTMQELWTSYLQSDAEWVHTTFGMYVNVMRQVLPQFSALSRGAGQATRQLARLSGWMSGKRRWRSWQMADVASRARFALFCGCTVAGKTASHYAACHCSRDPGSG